MKRMPVIDIFAGPGGLGEGFAKAGFDIRLSIEMDAIASETLKIRKFYYQFNKDSVPNEYYDFLEGRIAKEELKKKFPKEWEQSEKAILTAELGKDDQILINSKIKDALGQDKDFILIGGPPCQAYSLAGRSRMLGLGKAEKKQSDESEIDKKSRLEKLAEERSRAFFNDKRHTLYKEYIELLITFRPKIFIMENVKGILSAKNKSSGSVFDEITIGLRDPNSTLDNESKVKIEDKKLGYRLFSATTNDKNDLFDYDDLLKEIHNPRECIIRCEDFGIPQKRHRVIIIGVRSDINLAPEKLTKKAKVNVREAIEHLPKIRSGVSKTKLDDSYSNWSETIYDEYKKMLEKKVNQNLKIEQYINTIKGKNQELDRGSDFIENQNISSFTGDLEDWLHDRRLNGWLHHMARTHMSSDLARYLFCSSYGIANGRSPKIDDWEGDINKLKPKHQNIEIDKNKNLNSSSHKDRFKVQIWDEPSSTIVSHISKDGHYYIHPDPTQCRSLTVREAARLQTFPDNYFFYGGRTSKYHQVGNAVPPLLAFQIANLIKKLIKEETFRKANEKRLEIKKK